MPFGQQQCFKRPDGPERNQRDELRVLANDAAAVVELDGEIIAQQAAIIPFEIMALPLLLFHCFVGERLIGPDLAMGMRIARTHHLAAVFENLH